MRRLVSLHAALLLCAGCIGSSGNGEVDGGAAPPPQGDSSVPVTSVDGSVDGAIGSGDGSTPSGGGAFTTGLGAGSVVTHSSHFTLVTRTGGTPGGAGVKSSSSFKLISGVAPAAK